jgi:hypothetical protein
LALAFTTTANAQLGGWLGKYKHDFSPSKEALKADPNSKQCEDYQGGGKYGKLRYKGIGMRTVLVK